MKRLLPLSALALVPGIALAASSDCEVAAPCTIQGLLRISITPPVPTAVLNIDGTCIPLALPAFVFAEFERSKDRFVIIDAVAHSHAVADDVIWYQLQGRAVTGSICRSSPIALFVTEIKAQ
jgi:hypothetical protein